MSGLSLRAGIDVVQNSVLADTYAEHMDKMRYPFYS